MSFALFVAVCQCWVIFHLGSSMTPSTHFAVPLFNQLFPILHLFFWLPLFPAIPRLLWWKSWLDLRVFIHYIKTVLNLSIVFQNSHNLPQHLHLLHCPFYELSHLWEHWIDLDSGQILRGPCLTHPSTLYSWEEKLVFKHKLWPYFKNNEALGQLMSSHEARLGFITWDGHENTHEHHLYKLSPASALPSTTHCLPSLNPHCLEGGYKYTSSSSWRRKKRMQMGEDCSSAARALARRIMRSECRQECVEEWSWQGFTSLNYSKPIPSLIKPFCFFIFYFGGQRCFMEPFLLEHKIQALFTTGANSSWQDIALWVSFWCAGLLIVSFALAISEHLAFPCYVANLLDAGKYEIGSLKRPWIISDANINLKKKNKKQQTEKGWAEPYHMSYPDLFTSWFAKDTAWPQCNLEDYTGRGSTM